MPTQCISHPLLCKRHVVTISSSFVRAIYQPFQPEDVGHGAVSVTVDAAQELQSCHFVSHGAVEMETEVTTDVIVAPGPVTVTLTVGPGIVVGFSTVE